MSIFQAIIFGIVQGLGEFLPISSSGHLVILPWLFQWPDPGLAFDVALHFGTLMAVIAYFWKDWLAIFWLAFSQKAPLPTFLANYQNLYPKKLLWFLVLATIPGVIAGFLLENLAETIFRNPLLIALTLSLLGIILFLADKYSKNNQSLEKINLKQAIFIGFAQALAIIPGISRSGSTITTALMLGFDQQSAARFSFLLSTPIIFGAAALKTTDFLSSPISINEIIGIVTAAISGYLAIAWLLKFISKVSYQVFFWYRLALAVIIVIVFLLR